MNKKDYLGKKYGLLKILFIEKIKCSVICDCGNTKLVNFYDLRSGKIVSCGCLRSSNLSKYNLEEKNYNTGHGLSYHKIYNTYYGIIKRCYDEKNIGYKYYGAFGIKMQTSWINSVKKFYDYVSSLPNYGLKGRTLDRINSQGDYEEGNLRWATNRMQSVNKKNIVKYNFNGERLSLTEILERLNIKHKYSTIYGRIKTYGYSLENAVLNLK